MMDLEHCKEKKEDIWPSLNNMTKSPIPSENKSQEKTPRRHVNFDYTTIVNRLKTVSWSKYRHQTGVV